MCDRSRFKVDLPNYARISIMSQEHSILLVDDEATVLSVVTRWLTDNDYEVRSAVDGKEAIIAIESECPDIMIVDWKMPNMDGIELCGWVRSHELPKDVYILFLTARTAVEDVVEALSAGADDFLSKPVRGDELLSRVHLASRRLANAEKV